MNEYCLKCGEALEETALGQTERLEVKFTINFSGKSWRSVRMSYCPNKVCPRYGLLTWLLIESLEEAKKIREVFAIENKGEKEKDLV